MVEGAETTWGDAEKAGPPRILLVAPQPFYEDRGTPIALLHVLKSYVAHGYHVDVLTHPLGTSPPLEHVRYLRVGNPFGFKAIPIGLSIRKIVLDILLFFKLRKLLTRHRYTCVHAVEESAFLVALLRKKSRVPLVYDMQSNLAEQLCAYPLLAWRPLRALWYHCECWLIRHSSIVACSLGLADCVREVSPGKPVHEWHYPGQLVAVDDASVDRLRQELSLAPGQPIVMYTGNLAAYQGIDLLVASMAKAVERSPQVVFVLVGGSDDQIAQLDQRLSQQLSADRCRLVPRIEQDQVPAYLKLADVLVSPRTYGENLPLKVIEYLAAARPIVATDIKAHRRLLSLDTAVLVEPNAGALAEGIGRLLADETLRLEYARRGYRYYQDHLGQDHFHRMTGQLLAEVNDGVFVSQRAGGEANNPVRTVSVVIPVRNGAASLPRLIEAIHAQKLEEHAVEIIVVDDGSTDGTADVAREAGAQVVHLTEPTGNPAHARNVGALKASGEFLIFLDVDCIPEPGWLHTMLATHAKGWPCVGGALSMPDGLTLMSRLDYYCGWYHAHDRQDMHVVTQHPPCNLGVERSLFLSTRGFTELQPIAYAHEELAWQSELQARGIPILFQPNAKAGHHNREGLANVLRRSYRWAYSAVESKQDTGVTRFGWLYRLPLLAALAALPLVPLHTIYIVACWARVGRWEPLLLSPLVLLARAAYGCGMLIGTLRWMFSRDLGTERRPLWE